MIEALDHVAIAVDDLDRAATAYEALIGRPLDWREEAAGARHAWFQLGDMALDLVQPEGPGESGDRARAQLAAHGEGLWGFALAAADLAETRRVLGRRGARTADPMALLSTDAWGLAFIDPAASCGIPIGLCQRDPRRLAAPSAADDQILGLDHLVIRTQNADRALSLYGARLGLDFRLDRSNPAWGARLMFFRLGAAVLEIAAPLEAAAGGDAPDRLSGLAWKVRDAGAAHARLARGPFDISPVREGRRPGTQVFTVRSGFPGAPALMIQGADRD